MALNAHIHIPAKLVGTLPIALRGHGLLSSARFNKGTAFSAQERKTFGLEGRLPYKTNSLHEQCERAYGQLMQRDSDIRKNSFLQSLKDQNWVLYYALLARHLKELVPIIYTPTEAEAISNYSHLFRRSEGLFLTFPDQDRMEEDFLEQTRGRDIDLIVCTDSEAILGIGDQGVGGIGISTAKSVIYSLIGGMDPSKSLSVTLDVGTNNEDLLNDPLYVGWREKRVRGEAYDHFVDNLLHFEDFGVKNASRLLQKYHDTHAVFNDDIQGTGAVTLACLMAAIGVSRRSRLNVSSPEKNRLSDQRFVILGAGSAGMGIAVQIRDAMMAADGVSRDDANRLFWMVDRNGLLFEKGVDTQDMTESQLEFVRSADEGWGSKQEQNGLLQVVKEAKPTVLIGCSTASGAFTKEVVEAMMSGLDEGARPIIMPLSNPSRLAEAKPVDLLQWTNGRALVATGSPFGTVQMKVDGKDKEFVIAECNNALIYPGLGFGAILSQSRCVSDTMLLEGAKRLASLSPAISNVNSSKDSEGYYEYNGEALLPDFDLAPGVNFEVAVSVAAQAIIEGTASNQWLDKLNLKGSDSGAGNKDVRERIFTEVKERAKERVWVPIYPEYVYDENGLADQ